MTSTPTPETTQPREPETERITHLIEEYGQAQRNLGRDACNENFAAVEQAYDALVAALASAGKPVADALPIETEPERWSWSGARVNMCGASLVVENEPTARYLAEAHNATLGVMASAAALKAYRQFRSLSQTARPTPTQAEAGDVAFARDLFSLYLTSPSLAEAALLRRLASTSGAGVPDSGWQDISTAPKDGTDVLLWSEIWSASWGVQIGHHQGGYWITPQGEVKENDPDYDPNAEVFEDRLDDFEANCGPTHWRPLPPPPTAAETEAER